MLNLIHNIFSTVAIFMADFFNQLFIEPSKVLLQLTAKYFSQANYSFVSILGIIVAFLLFAQAAKGADVLITDVWASMGEEAEIPGRVRLLTPFKVTTEMMESTGNPDCLFMHCLPSFHDFETTMAKEQMELGYDIREVTDEVFRSKNSAVFDEAENRMHTIKAVMAATLGAEFDEN